MSARTARVLHVVLSLNPGGTERLVLEIAKRLHHEIPMSLCCLDDAGAWAAELNAEDIGVTALHRRAGFAPALGRAIARLAARHRATVLHCHHYSPFVYGCVAKLLLPRVRVIYTEHGRLSDAPPSRKRRLANAAFARVPSAVFAVSNDLRQHIIQEGFSPQAVDVIYNGIDIGALPSPAQRLDIRTRLNAAPETMVIGTIARLDPVKDLGVLLRAVSETSRSRPVLLVVIGDGPERAMLQQTAASLGIEDCVRFLGHRDDARDWLAGCDVYANSSISEGVSLTILEAMAAALPVVATRVGGTPEVVSDECGTLVPARDDRTLGGALMEMASDGLRRQQRGAAARRRVERLFALNRMVSDYRDVYLSG